MDIGALTGAVALEDNFSPVIDRVSRKTGQFSSSMDSATLALKQVDDSLRLLGINSVPVSKAFDELSAASGRSVESMTKLDIAGAAIGAGIAGWQIGRAIADFGDLDKKIGDATAKLLGFGDVAAQEAAVVADNIAKAQGKIQGLTVLTAETAQAINKAMADAETAANKHAADVADRVPAVARVEEAIKKVADEIAEFRQSGVVDDLTRQINTHVVSLKDLADQYHLSDAAMKVFADDAAHIADVEKKNADILFKTSQDLAKAAEDREKRKAAEAAAALAALYANIDAQTKANEAQHQKDIQLMDAQIAAKKATEEQTAALIAQKDAADRLKQSFSVSQTFDLSTKEGIATFKQMNPNATIAWKDADIIQFIKNGGSLAKLIAMGVISLGENRGPGSGQPPPPPPPPPAQSSQSATSATSSASSATNVTASTSAAATNAGATTSTVGGIVFNNTFNVGVGASAEQARKIGDELIRQLRTRLPYAAKSIG